MSATVLLVNVPVVDLALAGTIIHSAAERAALCEAALYLAIRMRAVNVVADAKLLRRSDLFVFCIQARTSDAFLEEADNRVLIRVVIQLVQFRPIHHETFFA